MPSLNIQVGPSGPVIDVFIAVSSNLRQALLAAGKQVPAAVTGRFLVDTGASNTCIDPNLITPLGLSPISQIQVQTPSTAGTPVNMDQYDVALVLLNPKHGASPLVLESLPVMECKLASQGIDGLIGRDVLDQCVLIYNGEFGMFTLSY